MPRVIIVGGPNGAGKTTFASAYLAIDRDVTEFVNADEIWRELTAEELLSEAARNARAARAMLERIDELVEARADWSSRRRWPPLRAPRRSLRGGVKDTTSPSSTCACRTLVNRWSVRAAGWPRHPRECHQPALWAEPPLPRESLQADR
jgi:hypothetical protein